MGTLFPLLKAAPSQGLDKVFFLTAKGSGRQLALDAAERIQAGQTELRVLELVARDKACEHPDKACHGDSCPLARGFYDRLPAARSAALEHKTLDKAALREVALAHQVCPYYLSQEIARWADVIVGDYNYYFDLSALLHSLTQLNQWRVSVLVDEAHNLVERARKMYSAELDQADFKALAKDRTARPQVVTRQAAPTPGTPCTRRRQSLTRCNPAVPEGFSNALQKAVAAITEHMAEHPTEVHPALQGFYFEALHFSRVLELFDEHSLFDVRPGQPTQRLCSACATWCPRLSSGPRLEAARSVALFSRHTQPAAVLFRHPWTARHSTVWVDVPTPFFAPSS